MALGDMFASWKALPRRRPPSPRYVAVANTYFTRFQSFLAKEYPMVKDAAGVQSKMARAFLKSEEDRGVSPKTYNNGLIFLRSCFEALRRDAGLVENPFDGIPTLESEGIYRKPYSSEELAVILKAAADDPFIKPIIVTGMCTAMRRGDCCLLPWSAVDLKKLFISVKTSKTGEVVQIPIFPLLETELRQAAKKKDPKYVFPEQALMYQSNPDGITYRVQKVLEQAGFKDAEPDAENEASKEKEETLVNADAVRGERHQKRTKGLRKASIRDFHSFRVTWVTLALTAGVPIEIVQRVTGHRTSQIVQKHYFQPGAEDFRRALTSKLPTLMAGTSTKPVIEYSEIAKRLHEMTEKNWLVVRDELLSLL